MPRLVGGKYRPLRVLGRGGMSTVYEVEHVLTRDHLALKVLKGTKGTLDAVSWARFKREARMSALMKNEHVVRVLDADTAAELDGAPFLVMDLLDGADLSTTVGKTPQAPERVVDWLRQAARALDLAHAHGIVHRDLKPANLFLANTADGGTLVKVLDFGVASIPQFEDGQGTATGAFVGTPLFMAPEQASGAEVGPPADIWAIGISAFRMLSGEDYWVASTVSLLLAKIVYEEPVAPSQRGFSLGAEFDAWFLKSCARRPDARWRTVGEQVEALAEALGLPKRAVWVPPPIRSPRIAPPVSIDYPVLGSATFDGRERTVGDSVIQPGERGASRLVTIGATVAFAMATAGVALLFVRGTERKSPPPPLPALERVDTRYSPEQAARSAAAPAAPAPSTAPSADVATPARPASNRSVRRSAPSAARGSAPPTVTSASAGETALPSTTPQPRHTADPLADPD
ncbi:MAG TPA: serine/threonine-protein kinase [Polyangiaceae bacterium]|nr:serine/threonine-protein kinase [Polyangiaceae bacterium]